MNRRETSFFYSPVIGRAHGACPPLAARVQPPPLLADARPTRRRAQGDNGPLLNQFVAGAGDLTVTCVERGNRAVLRFRGELDLSNRDRMNRALETVLAGTQPEVVFDLSELRFVDAHSVGTWHAAAASLRAQHRELVVRDPAPLIARLLALIGVDCVVEYS